MQSRKHKIKNNKYANHREIFEMFQGRQIKPGHEIHHADGNPKNNNIENLVERERPKHREIHRMSKRNRMPVKLSTDFVAELDEMERKIRKIKPRR